MGTVRRIQILDKSVCGSVHSNIPGNGMNSFSL